MRTGPHYTNAATWTILRCAYTLHSVSALAREIGSALTLVVRRIRLIHRANDGRQSQLRFLVFPRDLRRKIEHVRVVLLLGPQLLELESIAWIHQA